MLESCVALGRADPVATAQAVLKNLAEAVGGRYHCYSPEAEVSLLPLPSLPASKIVPGDLDQGRSCCTLASQPSPRLCEFIQVQSSYSEHVGKTGT